MARQERAALADMRALEEEAERHNPINRVHQSTRKGYTGIVRGGAGIVGAGATPSVGLSQKRGGASKKEIGEKALALHRAEHKALEGGRTRRMPDEEIVGMGRELGQHITELHGAGFFDDFAKGFMSVVSPIAKIAKPILSVIPHPAAQAASGVLGALGAGTHKGQSRKTARKAYEGGMDTGAYEGEGRHSKPKRVVGPNDGRRARAAIVKKVMSERGLSMVDASRYVKEHNLFRKKGE